MHNASLATRWTSSPLLQRWAVRTLIVCSCFLGGCGSDDGVYQLSGSVTYQGKPVPSGMIIFEPDSSQGNSGPPGRSKIVDGKYDTSTKDGHGVVGGPHRIRITGLDGQSHGATSGEIGLPNMLFPEYNVSEDLAKADGVKDFEVPVKR